MKGQIDASNERRSCLGVRGCMYMYTARMTRCTRCRIVDEACARACVCVRVERSCSLACSYGHGQFPFSGSYTPRKKLCFDLGKMSAPIVFALIRLKTLSLVGCWGRGSIFSGDWIRFKTENIVRIKNNHGVLTCYSRSIRTLHFFPPLR